MSSSSGVPVSVITEGPTFRDELAHQPQAILREEPIESLRLVPAKSAADGVYGIYFLPPHREWALVRLAKRYRWLFEIQLNRGMSGERQLIQQGFTPDDLEFLFSIIPAPPAEYNPIVYDMLWLVATYDEYRTLTEAILDRERFTPRMLFENVANVDESKVGFLTRFLRSHLIEPADPNSNRLHDHDDGGKSDLQADLDTTYEITTDGRTALAGILAEYDRIFERATFEPLLINTEADPRRHLKGHTSAAAASPPDVSIEELQSEDGVLGEIASSFSTLVDEADGEPREQTGNKTNAKNEAETRDAGQEDTKDGEREDTKDGEREDAEDGAATSTDPTDPRDGSEIDRRDDHTESESSAAASDSDSKVPEDTAGNTPKTTDFGEYTREEVVSGAAAAASVIHERTVARKQHLKEAVWDAVAVENRDRTELWEYVQGVLLAMESVHGRPGGRIWTALPS